MSLIQHPIEDLVLETSRPLQTETNPAKLPLEAMASVALTSAAAQKSGQNRAGVDETAEHDSKERQQTLQERLEFERVAGAIQRANAEQARRVSDCLRAAYETLLNQIAQPGLLLDMGGRILRWNPALARWSGIAQETAQNRMLPDLFAASALAALTSAQMALLTADMPVPEHRLTLQEPLELFPNRVADRLTLLPLYRIPGCLEAILILIEPQTI